jgi:hypothetical protein
MTARADTSTVHTVYMFLGGKVHKQSIYCSVVKVLDKTPIKASR